MLDVLVRIGFYLVVGLSLLIACVWYVRTLAQEFIGRPEVVIAPFEVVGSGAENKGLGVGLAHMLRARLRDVENEIADNRQVRQMGRAAASVTSASSDADASYQSA